MLTVHRFVKPVALRAAPAVNLRRYSSQHSAKEQAKDAISSKQTNQQARRQSELGASDQEVGQADSSTGDKSRADETVETGEPFSKGERTADKQTRHSKDRDADTVRKENADKAADIAKDSRQQGGYSQFSALFGSALLRLQPSLRVSPISASFINVPSYAFSTSARVMDDKVSTEEANSLKVRGQRPDGSSPQSSASSKDDSQPRSADNPGKPSGVKPSYKRASGMPHDSADEAHPFGSTDKRDDDFEAVTARKQPQKDKSTLKSVKDALSPEGGAKGGGNVKGGGETGDENLLREKGSKVFRDLKEGAQKIFGGGDGQKK